MLFSETALPRGTVDDVADHVLTVLVLSLRQENDSRGSILQTTTTTHLFRRKHATDNGVGVIGHHHRDARFGQLDRQNPKRSLDKLGPGHVPNVLGVLNVSYLFDR